MLPIRTSRFKVETSWQELVNRRIQKIEIDLKEINYINQAGFLLAKGTFKREIVYVEFDGRLRKVDDRVQFEVVVGKELPEPFPLLKTELKQDYYIFQPRQIGDNQAVLEQGFILVVQEIEPDKSVERIESIFVDGLVDQGFSSRFVKLILPLKGRELQFRSFNGTVHFETAMSPLIAGKIQGSLEYLTCDNLLHVLNIEQPVSWLLEKSWENTLYQCSLEGTIADCSWSATPDGDWELELKLDYSWVLIHPQQLSCIVPVVDQDQMSYRTVKTAVFLGEAQFQISKLYFFPFDAGIPTDIRITVNGKNERIVKRGLYLEAFLKIDAYYLGDEGTETYCQWEAEVAELIEDPVFDEEIDHLKLDTILQIGEVSFRTIAGKLRISFVINYQVKTFEEKMLNVIEDSNSGRLILAQTLVGTKRFTVMKEVLLTLRRKPFRIDKIRGKLNEMDTLQKKGWVQVVGELEAVVVYQNFSGKSHEEFFHLPFIESFVWEEIDNNGKLEIRPNIEFDSYHLEGLKVSYKFLIRFDIGFFKKQELKLKVVNSDSHREKVKEISVSSLRMPPMVVKELKVILEKEVPLKLGTPKEIAANKIYVARFEYREALNALLAEGILATDLEYWDMDGFLRRERVDVSFWKFIPLNSWTYPQITGEKFLPEIVQTAIVPVNSWPWQKGMVKVFIELSLRRSREVDSV